MFVKACKLLYECELDQSTKAVWKETKRLDIPELIQKSEALTTLQNELDAAFAADEVAAANERATGSGESVLA